MEVQLTNLKYDLDNLVSLTATQILSKGYNKIEQRKETIESSNNNQQIKLEEDENDLRKILIDEPTTSTSLLLKKTVSNIRKKYKKKPKVSYQYILRN